ncbi:cobalt-precorrin-6A reductase [Zavarzinia aquatilis]|uniref:Cobalt-precorrin-6A reductase n=1 Tax=Zavarzinia aquatilis TaxID=2211142 RepID=A0A317DYS5_9PROT|nr:cobalt-precorrin-6A reductase [Zavarzinia aquatilis]PWR18163.1 cobalt-precorrin-6A reductase [Zavarzinia aquatilis]
MIRPLILGGTLDAGRLARALAAAGIDGRYSYAGRTQAPAAQPLPTRIGGFGGVAGLVDYLEREGISHLIDATHPFAASMSAHAAAAAEIARVPLIALERAPWTPGRGDRWQSVPDMAGAARALGLEGRRVFLAIGRQHVADFAVAPRHHYLLRLVDAPDGPLPLPDATVILGRGPFTVEDDRALMVEHGIDIVVAKNAGGDGARAKLDAARALGLPVIMIDRPALPPRRLTESVDEVLAWLGHGADRGV